MSDKENAAKQGTVSNSALIESLEPIRGHNRLEFALLDPTGMQLDFYLEDTKTKDIMADIEAIKRKAACTTKQGQLKLEIEDLLKRF